MIGDKRLRWHKQRVQGMTLTSRRPIALDWRAWAIDLDPASNLPPYYVISKIDPKMADRVITLVWCRSCEGGPQKVEIGESVDLFGAKALAQTDYTNRIAALTT